MPTQNLKENSSTGQARKPRPPIVVVMGHVDHGKTSLLDHIRKANVAAREAGGITQAVGAYEITHNLRRITFIDTPGHEAFSAMRSRGAKIADIAVLVVAADEGVKPQTREAIEILKKTETPFVVAVNKIDKTGGDIERAKNDLMGAEVFLEGFGGQTSYHGVSAKTGEGVNELLDLLILAADVEGLTYDPGVPASGFVLEARHDKRRGVETTLILRDGALRRNEAIFTLTAQGKAKILENFLGEPVEALEPSSPAVVVGWESLPHAGESFLVGGKPGGEAAAGGRSMKLASKPDKKTLNLVLKASDSGSLEVLSAIVASLGTEEHPLYIVSESVGDITDGNVKTAAATGASIIGFKNKSDKAAKNLAEGQEVRIITSDIVYELVKAVEEFLAEAGKSETFGELEVLAIFNQKKLAEQLVGGKVLGGFFRNKGTFEVMRSGEKMGIGRIFGLREKKTDITQAEAGKEVGVLTDSKIKLEVGDRLVICK